MKNSIKKIAKKFFGCKHDKGTYTDLGYVWCRKCKKTLYSDRQIRDKTFLDRDGSDTLYFGVL